MKSLIICLAFLAAVCSGDEKSDWKKCEKEAEKFKSCLFRKMGKDAKENGAEMKKFMDDCKECFDRPETKGICKIPQMPTPGPAALPVARPSAQAMECFKGAATNFGSCMKKELKLPENFNMTQAMQEWQQGQKHDGMQQHNFGGHMPTKEEMDKFALSMCNNDTDAAKALIACGKEKAKPYAKALASLMNPLFSICKYKNECLSESPITKECGEKLKKGAAAFCTCRQEGVNYFNSSDSCKQVREAFGQKAAQAHESSANNYHDLAHHPDHSFDFCADLEKDVCADLAKKVEEWKRTQQQAASGSASETVAKAA